MVESKAFRNVLQKAEPRYSMPSRKHLSTKLIPQRYQNIYEDIVKLLSVSSQVCLTIDIWSNRQMRSYLGVTCHFIVDFKLQCAMLSCHRFRGSHTGERIIQLFEEIVASFNISGKVDRVITDNASNMKKAFRLLEISCFEDDTAGEEDDHSNIDDLEIIETEGLLNQLEFHQIVPRHHACFDHTLQLVIKDALKNAGHIQRVLGKISKLISHVRHSSQACELFENDHKLQIANVTRWNSQLTMIKSLLDTSDENMKKLEYSGKLTVSETNTTKDLLEVLTPFQWATDLTQGGNKVTASVVLPIVRGLRTELAKLEKKFLSSFVATLKSSLDSRLSQYEEDLTFQLAAALDPRWKLAWCTPEESANLRKIIFQKVNEIAVDSTVCVITLPEQSPPPKRSALFNFMGVSPIYSTELGTNTIDTGKIEEYLNSPCLSEFTEPLIFWKNNQYKYAGLSKLACKYLQIPASSAPVERIFSIAGKIFRPDRCRLSDDLFEKLMFIRCNSNSS